jgi:hypothetical protein
MISPYIYYKSQYGNWVELYRGHIQSLHWKEATAPNITYQFLVVVLKIPIHL